MNRADVIVSGGDMYAAIFLLMTAILPVDFIFSVDRKRTFVSSPSILRARAFETGQLVFVIQVVGLYFFAGFLKYGELWKNGEALSTIYRLNITAEQWSRWILDFPTCLKFISLAIPYFEMFALVALLPLTRLSKLKDTWLILILLMHLGILATMNVFYLPYFCIVILTALIPASWWRLLKNFKYEEKLNLSISKTSILIASAYALFMISINIHTIWKPFIPERLYALVEKIRLEQKWDFYGPSPAQENEWWVISGMTEFGSVWKWNKVVSFSPSTIPENPRSHYENLHWVVYLLSLSHPDYREKLMPSFARYLCRQNQNLEPAAATLSVELYSSSILSKSVGPVQKVFEYSYRCSK